MAAAHLTELLREANTSLVEGHTTLQLQRDDKPDGDALAFAYGYHSLVTGLERLALLTRKYCALTEFKDPSRVAPVLDDPGFQKAGATVANQLEACAPAIGMAAGRIAATMREWLNASPESARLLAMQLQTAIRLLKRRPT